jgi:hypothetical protein
LRATRSHEIITVQFVVLRRIYRETCATRPRRSHPVSQHFSSSHRRSGRRRRHKHQLRGQFDVQAITQQLCTKSLLAVTASSPFLRKQNKNREDVARGNGPQYSAHLRLC